MQVYINCIDFLHNVKLCLIKFWYWSVIQHFILCIIWQSTEFVGHTIDTIAAPEEPAFRKVPDVVVSFDDLMARIRHICLTSRLRVRLFFSSFYWPLFLSLSFFLFYHFWPLFLKYISRYQHCEILCNMQYILAIFNRNLSKYSCHMVTDIKR